MASLGFRMKSMLVRSTESGDSYGRRWLAYDLTGGISLKEDEGIAILETSFHDTVANSRRIAPLRDYHAFTMASLGEKVSENTLTAPFSTHRHFGPHTHGKLLATDTA